MRYLGGPGNGLVSASRTSRVGWSYGEGTAALKATVAGSAWRVRCRTRRQEDPGLIFGKKLGMETLKTIAKHLVTSF